MRHQAKIMGEKLRLLDERFREVFTHFKTIYSKMKKEAEHVNENETPQLIFHLILMLGHEETMATGRSNKLVGQTGEYLIAAELSRRGLIATTFTGNVPHYDIIASDEAGRHVSVQVKASRNPSWQFGNITQYCDIMFDGKRQIIGDGKPCPVQRLILTFVKIEDKGNDRFYILSWERLRDLMIDHHKSFLAKHNGLRPKNWKSLHSAIPETTLRPYQDKSDTIEKNLK